jgi:hypothetical protein
MERKKRLAEPWKWRRIESMVAEKEPPTKRAPRKDGGGIYKSLDNVGWAKLMAESLKGAEDKDMSDKYGVPISTIRQRRYNDPAWRVAHERVKDISMIGTKNVVETAKTTPLSLVEIAALNPELLANFTYNALKVAIDQGLIPLPTSWSEAKTAMEMMRKSTGQDDKTTNIKVNLWSGGGASPAPSVTVEAEIVSQESQEDWI